MSEPPQLIFPEGIHARFINFQNYVRARFHPDQTMFLICALSGSYFPRPQVQHGALFNQKSCIYQIPDEILLMVFLFTEFAPIPLDSSLTTAEAWNWAKLIYAATSVCSRFYTILGGAAEFWNLIIFTPFGRKDDSDVVRSMIWRSRERPLRIVWDCEGTRLVASTACVNSLRSIDMARICTLSIRLTAQGTRMTAGVFEYFRPLPFLCETLIECHDGCADIPFIPSGVSTTALTVSSLSRIANFDFHFHVNFPQRLATTLLSLTLQVLISPYDLNNYLFQCTALQHFEWVISADPYHFSPIPPLEEEGGEAHPRNPVLYLPKTLNSIVIAHPFLVPRLHGRSLKHARLDVHDHKQLEISNWEDWFLETPHVPRLKTLWLSCTCIATNGMLEGMVNSAALNLKHINLGVQVNSPKGVLYAVKTLRRAPALSLQSISFGIYPQMRFHAMWEKAAMELRRLLAERGDLHIRSACVNRRLPKPIQNLIDQQEDNYERIILHSVSGIPEFYRMMKEL